MGSIFTTVSFSAATLVKSSAAQIRYYRDNPKPVTVNQVTGESYQHKVASLLNSIGEELKTSVLITDEQIIINACHDIITERYLLEVKNVTPYEGGVDKWYLESSILQCAFYKTLVMLSNGNLTTPKFRLDAGVKNFSTRIDTDIRYLLLFGEALLEVNVTNPSGILEYFVNKAVSTLYSYDNAKAWDNIHKHREFEETSNFFEIAVLQDVDYNIVDRPWDSNRKELPLSDSVNVPDTLLSL